MKWKSTVIGAALLVLSAVAPVSAGDWQYPVGVTYSSGFNDVLDYHEDASVAPYVRVGVRYNIAGGDFVDGSSPGFI